MATELGLKWGGLGVEWRRLGFKCSSLHFRNPHISDFMSSLSGSMQSVICCDVYSGHICGWTYFGNRKVTRIKETAATPFIGLKIKVGRKFFKLKRLKNLKNREQSHGVIIPVMSE